MADPDFHRLAAAYSKARFKDVELPGRGLPDSFAIITACNPDGFPIGGNENLRLTLQLSTRLRDLGLGAFPATGYDPASDHAEPGFGVHCDLEIACHLGREFRQVAVFFVEGGQVQLVSCGPGHETVPLRSWVELCD